MKLGFLHMTQHSHIIWLAHWTQWPLQLFSGCQILIVISNSIIGQLPQPFFAIQLHNSDHWQHLWWCVYAMVLKTVSFLSHLSPILRIWGLNKIKQLNLLPCILGRMMHLYLLYSIINVSKVAGYTYVSKFLCLISVMPSHCIINSVHNDTTSPKQVQCPSGRW